MRKDGPESIGNNNYVPPKIHVDTHKKLLEQQRFWNSSFGNTNDTSWKPPKAHYEIHEYMLKNANQPLLGDSITREQDIENFSNQANQETLKGLQETQKKEDIKNPNFGLAD